MTLTLAQGAQTRFPTQKKSQGALGALFFEATGAVPVDVSLVFSFELHSKPAAELHVTVQQSAISQSQYRFGSGD